MAILRVEQVSKWFGALRAVDRVSLSVDGGEIVGLIGPNGAGKTTLFHLISGVLRPDEGEIVFRGTPITRATTDEIARRGLTRTFQDLRVFERLTVWENLQVARGGPAAATLARNLLDITGLAPLRDEYAYDLSYGQQKLLATARALMLEPEVVLLDEPMAGINPTLGSRLLDLLRLENQRGRTFVIIEHNVRVIMNICHRVVAFLAGRKIAEGSAQDVAQNSLLLDVYFGSRDLHG